MRPAQGGCGPLRCQATCSPLPRAAALGMTLPEEGSRAWPVLEVCGRASDVGEVLPLALGVLGRLSLAACPGFLCFFTGITQWAVLSTQCAHHRPGAGALGPSLSYSLVTCGLRNITGSQWPHLETRRWSSWWVTFSSLSSNCDS